jgi:predicted transcriptional regulator of viral defense system
VLCMIWFTKTTNHLHEPIETVWSLARRQHGVVARRQLLNLGLHPEAIKHRLRKGRLHRVRRGVYAVGRPNLTQRGHWMAAVLASGPNAFLSHRSAAALWGIRRARATLAGNQFIDVTVDARRRPRCDGVRLHRVRGIGDRDRTRRDGIPVTSPIKTLIDLALVLSPGELETAINEATDWS